MRAHCIVAISALFIPHSFASIVVDTPPNAVACAAIQLSWQGGTAPWSLSILSASPPNNALDNLVPASAVPATWIVDLTPGTTVILSVKDSAGDSGVSSPFTIGQRSTLGGGGLCSTGGSQEEQSSSVSDPPQTSVNGGNGKIGTGHIGGSTSTADSTNPTDTGTSTGSSGTSSPPQGGSQGTSPQGGSQTTGDPSQKDGSDSSSVSPGQDSSPVVSPASDSLFSIPSSTSFTAQSAGGFNFNSVSGEITNSLGSPTLSFGQTVGGQGGQIQPATGTVQSGDASAGTGQSRDSNNFSKKNVMSGSIIGGIIAAVLCLLVAAFCVIRRCRRRRLEAPDRLSYPFSDSEASSGPRQMVGRSGYPPSVFSSWGNHGDLDERALSPTATAVHSTEGQPMWEPQGTIESRYQAAFIPGHGSSSSIDRNDPSSQHFRSRGPIPKSMTDAYHAGPSNRAGPSSSSAAIMGDQPYSPDQNDGHAPQVFHEIRPQEMPSWGTAQEMMAGRHPVVVGYPPPYTSK